MIINQLLAAAVTAGIFLTPIFGSARTALINFEQWYQTCQELPKFKDAYEKKLIAAGHSPGTFKDAKLHKQHRGCNLAQFEAVLDLFLKQARVQLKNTAKWLDTTALTSLNKFSPFVQKLCVDNQTLLVFKGDLHADVHSLLLFFKHCQQEGYLAKNNGFKIVRPDVHFIFLGDYVDRGLYGVEVLYTLMRFKLANPNQVILVRGNHEDPDITYAFGFYHEFDSKFSDETKEARMACYNKLTALYNALPMALYVGSPDTKPEAYNFLQACHGGLEIGYNPQKLLAAPENISYQLITSIDQKTACKALEKIDQDTCCVKHMFGQKAVPFRSLYKDFVPESPTVPQTIGFMWNDFIVDPQASCEYNAGRGFAYNRKITREILKAGSTQTHKLRGVIRAHQHMPSPHDPLMRLMLSSHGVARLWSQSKGRVFNCHDNLVCTLMLAPQNLSSMAINQFQPDFTYDTWLLLKTAPEFNQWRGVIYNNQVE